MTMRFRRWLPVFGCLALLIPEAALAQTVRQCEGNDAACRQIERRTTAQGTPPRPSSRTLRQGSDGTLAPRTGRYRENGIFGQGQRNGGCDTRSVGRGQRANTVPNC
ncbi:hypothetical protein [Aureimonas sp. AU20]|uniref:hypothetical protein n=1 Tax=Aureimonas sp. AU20 TaxID=1349819 RepID=UPI00072082A5|nr:hypothetical protein [Aureimonas sp. AU20]ALN72027.1 hypothetical protein M673_04820 [Aureimonas sp. AU20]